MLFVTSYNLIFYKQLQRNVIHMSMIIPFIALFFCHLSPIAKSISNVIAKSISNVIDRRQ